MTTNKQVKVVSAGLVVSWYALLILIGVSNSCNQTTDEFTYPPEYNHAILDYDKPSQPIVHYNINVIEQQIIVAKSSLFNASEYCQQANLPYTQSELDVVITKLDELLDILNNYKR